MMENGRKQLVRLDRKLRKAMDMYGLIDAGDHLLIGLSGGKDSLALVELIGRKMRVFNPRFTATALHVSMENIPYQSNLDYLQSFVEAQGIGWLHRTTRFDLSTDRRKSPCFLCSWHRRKVLFEVAKEIGATKIALGHHQDDMIETLLMNMTYQGSISTMPPRLAMDKFPMTIIRPMCLITESELRELACLHNYQLQVKNCPYECTSSRSEMKEVVSQLEALNPNVRSSMWESMHHVQQAYLPTPYRDDSNVGCKCV